MSNSTAEERQPLFPQTITIPTPSSLPSLYLSSLSSSVENVANSDSDSDDSEPFLLLDVDPFFLDYLLGKKDAGSPDSYQSDIEMSSTEVNPPVSEKDVDEDENENHSSCCPSFGSFGLW